MEGRRDRGGKIMTTFEAARRDMVENQLMARGIIDEAVLNAMGEVPREKFVPLRYIDDAYGDHPVPIGYGQTISQPYMVALMAEALDLKRGDRVLEIGTGSGYAAAVLSRIVRTVHTVERLPELAKAAARRLRELGYHNVHVREGDGTLGLPEHAPYQGISVTAGAPDVPRELPGQLALHGKLVVPVGAAAFTQSLLLVERVGAEEYRREDLGLVQFVPLVGVDGWGEQRMF